MRTVFLGDTGVRVSKLCLGTMTFGKEADEATSAAIYARARDAGVNFFDTANGYAQGRSEEILGRLVAPHRDEIVLATKSYFPTSADPNARGSSRYHIVRAVEASLRRLGTDRIDIHYLHRFDDVTSLEQSLRAVEDLVRAGKILYPAVSNFAAWQAMKALGIQRAAGYAPLVAFQPMYNLAKRQAEVEILPLCASEKIAVVPYSPIAGGLLSGKYAAGARPSAARLVENKMYGTRYAAAANYELAERFTAFATERGVHPVTLAVAWVAEHPAVTAPIIGARSAEQIEPSLAAGDLELGDLRDEISKLSPAPPPATDRNEEATAHNYGAR